MIASSCVVLCAALVAPRDCETAALDTGQGDEFETEHRRLQGPGLQATLLPGEADPWLQGRGLRAALADGRHIEIVAFAGDVVHARAPDAGPDAAPDAGPDAGPDAAPDSRPDVRLRPADLVGMRWSEARCEAGACRRVMFRVAAALPDHTGNTMPAHGSNRDTWLYRVEHADPDTPGPDAWTNVCAGEPGGGDMGLFVDGRWSADGAWQAGGYTFSCARGAVAKCARSWGYKPWKALASPAHGPVSLQPLHAACTRAARADYCGDGVPHTREGILVGMRDRYGFNPAGPPRGAIEAVFDERGAVRVHDWRVPDLAPACTSEVGAAGAAGLIEVWR